MTSKAKQRTDRAKILVGKKYRNTESGSVCTVACKDLHSVVYLNEDDPFTDYPRKCHPKIFYKYWVLCDEINTPSMEK